MNLYPVDNAIASPDTIRHDWFPREMTSEKRLQKFHSDDVSQTVYLDLPISSGHISCTGKMAYVSQTPWVYSGTVRENIVFGMPFCEEKYNAIVEVCDLKKDLTSFPKNDLTEIGQRFFWGDILFLNLEPRS